MTEGNRTTPNLVKIIPKSTLSTNLLASATTSFINPTRLTIPGRRSNISSSINPAANKGPFSATFTSKLRENSGDITFKGDSLQQLSTNALPSYVPSPPPNIANADVSNYEYHCCTDCGDTFALKLSLDFHLDRRSVLIKLACDACKTIKVFYNRCSLLSHIRSHTDKMETSDIAKAMVSPLPRIFMDGFQAETNSGDNEATSLGHSGATTAADLLELSLKEAEGELGEPEKDEEQNLSKVKCLDCNEEFKSSAERALHYINNDKIPLDNHQCTKCDMICPSKCFLKAHQRIHLQVSPYICPECGESPSPMWQKFQCHVRFKCHHYARSVGYACQICKRLSPNKDSLLKHMDMHTEKFIKCDACANAFTGMNLFKAHLSKVHPGEKVIWSIIYKCSLCTLIFTSSHELYLHGETHMKNQACEFVFNCMQCSKPFQTKPQLNDHLKTYHPKTYKTIQEKFELAANAPESSGTIFRGKVECMLCSCFFHSMQGYQLHLKKAHVNHNLPCVCCRYTVPRNRQEMIEHGKMHLDKGVYLCLLCNNKRWADAKQLSAHLVKHVIKLEHCTCCPICDVLLRTGPEAVSHLQKEHKLFNEIGKSTKILSLKRPQNLHTCHFCRESFVKDDELQEHLQVKHKIAEVRQNNSSEGEAAANTGEREPAAYSCDGEPAAKIPRQENGNMCAKCDFHSTDREEFKKHILTHKTSKSTLQCQECGLCFVVEPALEKHLRIAHKVKDTKKYIETEGTNCVLDHANPADASGCNSLLCSVCLTSFPNETTLKTHMRSHGMAFIHKLQTEAS